MSEPTCTGAAKPYVPFFNILPLEIREQIWLFTFSPRIIQLHIHHHEKYTRKRLAASKRFTQHTRNSRRTAPIPDPPKTLIGVSFTATLVRENQLPQFYMSVDEWEGAQPASGRCPAAPVALHVCQESRTIAMKQYELGFAGRNFVVQKSNQKAVKTTFEKRWIKQQLGESKIWFNFELDMLLLHAPLRFHRTENKTGALKSLLRHATYEMQKVKTLGIAIYCPKPQHFPYGIDHDVEQNLRHFTQVRDLTFYDLMVGKYEPQLYNEGPFPPGSIGQVRDYLISRLQHIKDLQDAANPKTETKSTSMPCIKVLRIL